MKKTLKTILEASKLTGFKRTLIYYYLKIGKIKGVEKTKKVMYIDLEELKKIK